MSRRRHIDGRFGTSRFEAFSDGVYAIAITILVLEIGVPAGSEDDLLGAVLDEWHSYLAYLISFATIGASWLAHSAMTHHLEAVDSTLVRLNLLLLLVVSFIPFPTRLLAEYGGADDAGRIATTVYGLTLLLSAAMTSVLWLYARRAALIDPSASEDELAYLTERLTPGLAGYGAFIVGGLFLPTLAVVGYLAIALFFLVPTHVFRGGRPQRG
ncbi:MAG TPA: TMEM175 family protein [Solirubrobacteraceae bacterium]|nr:TMEM175 family protein [Solirubrobacteraceae bacterium]